MPKKRKTRKQKLLTTQKKQEAHIIESGAALSQQEEPKLASPETGITFSLPAVPGIKSPSRKKSEPARQTVTIETTEYAYLGKDLLKTAIVTGIIVLVELLIRMFYLH